MQVYDQSELGFKAALKRASNFLDFDKGPILEIYKNPRYNDEPLLYQYTAVLRKTSDISDLGYSQSKELAGGMSFIREKAVLKTLGEAIERYCLSIYKRNYLIYKTPENLDQKALDLTSVVSFSATQLKQKKRNNLWVAEPQKKLWWTKGFSLTQNRPIFIPAQLVYMPYRLDNEPLIRLPITTGAAAGTSLSGAIERGINEVVERDAFMIFYLNKLTPPILDLQSSEDSETSKIPPIFKRYNLELYVFDISIDIPIPSIMAIIVDRTGFGPAVSVGLKASLNSKAAIIGAIEEAQHIRPWIRDVMLANTPNSSSVDEIDLRDRGLLWVNKDMIKKLDFFLKSKKVVKVDKILHQRKITHRSRQRHLISMFKKAGLEVIFTDVTSLAVKKVGFVVVKVVIPQLQPLYLLEDTKYLGGTRLYQIPVTLGYTEKFTSENQLNKIPHPFL